ncbi:MAG: putative Ig domain-containing protein [Candidatus Eisenbacteria bacterium]|nr:putative Ig domain-containing protein [Candidatus Eisenbacteria bacterium]
MKSVGPDGVGTIGVTAVKSRDCVNTPIPVMAGAQASVVVHNALLALEPPVLGNGLAGVAYSQSITTADGVAPYTYSLLTGALPAGLTLSAAGELSGTPSATGTFAFTVGVSDAAGCPGSRAYSLTVSCSPISVSPPTLPNAQLGVPYMETLSASSALLPVAWSVSSGSLPAGLTLSPTTGEISGTPSAPGFHLFTLTATDPAGCTGEENYALSVFTDPAASNVAANVAGLCLSAVHTTASVPFVYTRGENATARAVSVTFTLDTGMISLVTPATPAASIQSGTWLAGYANRTFAVVDNGGGSYTVNLGLAGSPCGPDSGGVLFTVNVQSVAGDGAAALSVAAVSATDCAGAPLPVVPGALAPLSVSHAAPPAISDLAATQVTTGNGGSGRTAIVVTWTQPQPGPVALYRAPFGSYPEYDDDGGTAPDSALAPAAPWTLVSANATSGVVDVPPVRGSWHYVAFCTDSCGNVSAASNRSNGALDYHLGDVSNRVTPGVGDNRVALDDVSLLGAHYGISGATLVTDGVAYLDVGPTVDGLSTSRPTTDNVIDFEDLLVFATQFHEVSAPQDAAAPARAGAEGEVFEVEAPSLVAAGQEFVATLTIRAGGRLQGFSAPLAWDASVAQPLSFESAGFIEGQGGVVLSPRPGTVDAALFGRRARGMDGAGEVARVRFRALREGDPGIRCGEVIARGAGNMPLDPALLTRESRELAPERTVLLAPAPNPARGAALVSFALARAGAVDLALYGVDGRHMATLARGAFDAGVHRVDWRGGGSGGGALAPGIYWLRLEAAGERFTRRLVLLR